MKKMYELNVVSNSKEDKAIKKIISKVKVGKINSIDFIQTDGTHITSYKYDEYFRINANKIIDEMNKGVIRKFIDWLLNEDLLKNRIVALVLLVLGNVSILFTDGDKTILVFTLAISLLLLFANKNYVE